MNGVHRWTRILRCSRAMTLLEIMLALLVLAMVIFMVSLSLSGSLRVIDSTQKQGEIYFRAQVALQRISEDLASALLVDGFEFIGEKVEIDGLRADSLAFTSTAHVVFDPEYDNPGIALISYRVVSDDAGEGELVLLRGDSLLASTVMSDSGSEEKRDGYLLSDSLRSVRFAYFDEGGEEHDTWNTLVEDQPDASPRKLPVSVQCTLDFWLDRENESSLEFTTRILLPVGLINAEST
jgi:type II secretory pathway pseudopilin PulG